jgi:hypothetical protein
MALLFMISSFYPIKVQAHNISLSASINATPDKQKPATQHAAHVASTDNQFSSSFANVLSATYDAPKRTRFSFKPEHLVVYTVSLNYIKKKKYLSSFLFIYNVKLDPGKGLYRKPVSGPETARRAG